MQTLKIKIRGVNCNSCANLIEDTLRHTKGIKEAKVNFSSKKAIIVYDENELDSEDIIRIIQNLGDYKVEEIEESQPTYNEKKIMIGNQIPTPFIIGGSIIIASLIIGIFLYLAKKPNNFGKFGDITTTSQPINFVNNQPEQNSTSKVNVPLRGNEYLRGNKNAPVTIIEFVDLQCPFCARVHPVILQITKDYGDKVKWVYKHFPLEAIHPQARPAALAAECIGEQKGDSGFWQFIDLAFENQQRLGEDLYKELAQKIGAEMNKFLRCFSEKRYDSKINADIQDGNSVGVRGTPTIFINGKVIPGAVPYDTLKTIIDSSLSNQ